MLDDIENFEFLYESDSRNDGSETTNSLTTFDISPEGPE